MKKGWNRCPTPKKDGTDDPRYVEWACLVSHLVLLGSARKVLFSGVIRVHPNPTCELRVFLSKHNAFDLPNHFHFFQGQAIESAACESAQTFARATIQEAPKADVSPRTPFWIVLLPRARGVRITSCQIKSPKKPIEPSVVRKAQTNAWEISNRPRVGQGIHGKGMTSPLGQAVRTRTWGPVTIPLPHFTHASRGRRLSSPTWILCGGDPPSMTARENYLRDNGTVIERKPTPGHQHLAA